VGGTPRPAALAWIRAHEGLDRGWYAAPVGWLDAQGDGEFVVALRSGLIDGATAHLFAGCGIMGDSDPAAEVAESRLKLRPMLAALAASSEQQAASEQPGHSQLAARNSQPTP
jgi:isochorismate synthase EntC